MSICRHIHGNTCQWLKKEDEKILSLKLDKWLSVHSREEERVIFLKQDDKIWEEMTQLDGCYVIKTDLPQEEMDKQGIHDRYRDLAEVERAFRDCKTVNLEVRQIHIRTETSTRGQVLVVMLAYMIIRHLRQARDKLEGNRPAEHSLFNQNGSERPVIMYKNTETEGKYPKTFQSTQDKFTKRFAS